MKHLFCVVTVLCLASCVSTSGVTRVEIPPPNLSAVQALPAQNPIIENEDATMDFLQLQIDMSSEVRSFFEPEIRIVERVSYGDERTASGGRYSHHRRSTFPIRTVFGAGLGAIIGHQSGHRGGGAAIGAGIGLLLDLLSW